jgi:hypothetical protein
MGESENKNIQKYRSKSLSAVLDLCLEMARGREIDIDESYIYETFKKTAKKYIPDVTDEEISRTIEEYKRMKK